MVCPWCDIEVDSAWLDPGVVSLTSEGVELNSQLVSVSCNARNSIQRSDDPCVAGNKVVEVTIIGIIVAPIRDNRQFEASGLCRAVLEIGDIDPIPTATD